MNATERLERDLAAARQMLRKLADLEKIYTRINAATEIETILDVITDAAGTLTGCEAGSLMLLDPQKQFLYFKIAQGDKSSPLKEMRVPVGEGIAGMVARTGQRLLVNAGEENPHRTTQFDDKTGFVSRGMLCVPVMVRDELIGVLEVLNKLDGARYTADDIEILERLATAAGIAINKAKLLLAARRQYQNMKLIHEVNALITSTLLLDDVLAKLVDAIARAMKVTRCSVMLLEGQALRVRGAVGMPDAALEAATTPLGEGIAGQVAKLNRPALVPDIEEDEAFARPNDYDRYRNKSFISVPIRNSNGAVLGVLNISNPQDNEPFHRGSLELLEQLAAQAGVAISNARLYRELEQVVALNEGILQGTHNGIVAVAAGGTVSFANRAFGDIFATDAIMLMGEPKDNLCALFAGTEFPALLAAALRGEPAAPAEYTVTVGSDRRIVTVAPAPLAGAAGADGGVLIVIADVTRERELATHLKQAERLAALGQLAAGIAHEIRNPLNLIRGFAQLIHRKAPDDEVIAGNSGIIVQEVDRLNDLVQGMLDFARKETLTLQPLNVHALLDRVLNLFCEDDTYQMPVDLVDGDTALTVMGDEKKLTGVWLNLLRNAGDAMAGREGGITVSYGVDPADPGRVEVHVADRGCGIPAEEIPLLFTPFRSTKASGTGLGLAIAHKVIEAHGGLITVSSAVDKGTTFTVQLPRAEGA